MQGERPEKKSETLEVRIPHSKKEAFKAACERDGITASHAMRSFIDAYLKRSERVKLQQIIQDTTMTLIKNPVKTTGGLLALTFGTFAFLAGPSTAELDRDAQPISPPLIVYPQPMIDADITGACEAKFDVTADGIPQDVAADCTHQGFVEEVVRATQTMRFEPKRVNGDAVPRQNVVYPFVFELSNEEMPFEDHFADMDKDGDGQLSKSDNISQNWLDEMDQDGDGRASPAELQTYIENSETE